MSSATMIKLMGEKLLAQRQSINALSTEDLRALAQGENIACEVNRLAKTLSGLACLISEDGRQDKPSAGNFQHSSDVSELLFSIGEILEAQAECVFIASQVEHLLGQRGTMQH